MEVRSSRRMRTLVTRMANEIARALISIVARSTTHSNQRPDTLMQDRSPPTRRSSLATHGRTIHRVTFDRVVGLRPGPLYSESDRSAPCRDGPLCEMGRFRRQVQPCAYFPLSEWLSSISASIPFRAPGIISPFTLRTGTGLNAFVGGDVLVADAAETPAISKPAANTIAISLFMSTLHLHIPHIETSR